MATEISDHTTNAWCIKTAQKEDIYRPKKRCTWIGSTSGTNLTKDTVRRHNSMKENSGVKEQYSATSIFGRIYQHCTIREQKAFTLNHHHTTTPDNSRLYLWKQQTLHLKAADSTSKSSRLYIWQQQTTRGYAKILYPSSFSRMLGGCISRSF